jgi:hypothetical protein
MLRNVPVVFILAILAASMSWGSLSPDQKTVTPMVMITLALSANAAAMLLILLRAAHIGSEELAASVAGRMLACLSFVGLFALAHVLWLTPQTGVERPNDLIRGTTQLRDPKLLLAMLLLQWATIEAMQRIWSRGRPATADR